ncbi:hypothetical protein NDU88_003371 [Pleurodeles waltl]|uniref:Secreted protein n=1 Tax=Pleurodeles waltl TaxID=8319 RepID=A0AAV7TPK6_PLEWA|nr:hypothetical protein NDU88_003371 [Pleurodeles waltl]
MRRSASSFPSAAAAASSLVSPLCSSVLAEPGWPKRAQTPGLSVCGERSGTAPSVTAVWPQIQQLSAWVLVGGADQMSAPLLLGMCRFACSPPIEAPVPIRSVCCADPPASEMRK